MAKTGRRGKKDDSDIEGFADIETLGDLAELAARLRSPLTYSRSGNVLAIETWRHGLNKVITATEGTGSAVVLVNNPSLSDGVACQLQTSNSISSLAKFKQYYLAPQEVGIGWEAGFCITGSSVTLTIQLSYYTGVNVHQFQVYYEAATTKLQIYEHGEPYTSIDTALTLKTGAQYFNNLKLIINMETGYYNRLYLNDALYSLQDYQAVYSADTTTKRLEALIQVAGGGGSALTVTLDNIILTQNEELPSC